MFTEVYVVSQVKVNSLWPSYTIRRQGTESTMAQVMACCLTAPSHYLNQCWLIISKVLWHSSEGIIMRISKTRLKIPFLELHPDLPGANKLMNEMLMVVSEWDCCSGYLYYWFFSHCGDKMILRPSYLHNRISYTGKTTSLYWIRPLIFIWVAVTWQEWVGTRITTPAMATRGPFTCII